MIRAFALGLIPLPYAAVAAEPQQDRIAALVARERAVLAEAGIIRGCKGATESGEIVVCAKLNHDPDVPPPLSTKLIDIPNLSFGAPAKGFGVGVTMRACFLQRCPRPYVLIDLKAIPEPPPGSDAYLIGHGLARDR